MEQNLTELSQLLDLLKRHGVTRFRSGDLELELQPEIRASGDAFPKIDPKDRMPSDEELLTYSTPYFEDAERKAEKPSN